MAGAANTSAASGKSANGKEQTGADVVAAATEVTDQIQEQVSGLGQQVRRQATEQLATQKDRLADTLGTVSLLLHQSGEHAELQDKAMLAQYVDQAAEKVDSWSKSLHNQDVTQLLEETKSLARRQPLLFVSSALALGFAGSRFFRSSAQPAQESQADSTSTNSTPVADDLALNSGDQYASADSSESTGTMFGVVPDPDMSRGTDPMSGTGGYLGDVEGSFLESDGTGADSLPDLDELTRPEQS